MSETRVSRSPFQSALGLSDMVLGLVAAWRPCYEALNRLFILPIGDREGWVSSYLPVNAPLRGLAGHVMPVSLLNGVT